MRLTDFSTDACEEIRKKYEGKHEELVQEYCKLLRETQTKKWTPALAKEFEVACQREARLLLDEIAKADNMMEQEVLWGQLAGFTATHFKWYDEARNSEKK